MRFLGIDPGLGGAACVIGDGEIPLLYTAPVVAAGARGKNVPDLAAMNALLSENQPIELAVVEEVNGNPKFGSSNFVFGGSYYGWQALLTARGIPFVTVRPKRWQAAFGITGKGKGTKAQAKAKANALFPIRATESNADAVLLAEYARRLRVGGAT